MTDNKNSNSNTKMGFGTLKPLHKAICIALVTAAALVAVCIVTDGGGRFGGGIRSLLRGLFSWGSLIIPIALVAQAVGFADDLASKGFAKRSVFALVSASIVSCIEYAIVNWNNTIDLSPAEAFINMNNGGFIGGTIGYLLTYAFSHIGAIIISVMVLAIYSVFFFAEKAGSLGQAALNLVAKTKNGIALIKDKYHAHVEKKKQIKADADQHEREVKSQELIDDEFFKAKGDISDVKIKQLGIEENASTHGLSPLVDHPEVIVEEPVVAEEEPEVRRRRADKPLDLNYGMDSNAVADTHFTTEQKPAAKTQRSEFGLDDSADSVFTRDFDPFDFATSEKKAAKYASKVSGGAVTEELDEMTIYQMKADHEPDERERRLMELERKKQEWLKKRQANQPAAASAPTSAPKVAESTPVISEPVAPSPAVAPQPAPAPVVEEVKVEAPVAEKAPAPTSIPTTRPAVPQRPIKTVEFTVSKSPSSSPASHTESRPTATTKNPTHTDESAEDVAKIISQRISSATPGYIRSANDLKTYTKVSANGDDELYRQIEGISTESAVQENDEAKNEPAASQSGSVSCRAAEHSASVEFTVESDIPTQTEKQPAYQSATSYTTATVSEPAAPQFKPYTPPTVDTPSTATPVAPEENVLKAERSMLPPTPEAIMVETPVVESAEEVVEPKTEEIAVPTEAESVSTDGEIDFIPVDSVDSEEEIVLEPQSTAVTSESAEPLFDVVTDEDDEDKSIEEDEIEIDFDDDDEDDSDDNEPNDDDDEDEGDEEIDEDIDEGEESADEEDGEIPPEEQNPDVIKMREMFPFLTPIGEQKAAEVPKAEKVIAAEPEIEEDDDVPFDGAVEVKAAPAPTSLVPVAAEKNEKKKKDKPDYSDYQFPSLDFLAKQEEGADDNTQAEIQENADKLIETLADFGVTASIKGVDRGPRITRFEVVPAKGVKVSSILNLQDDIALNLAAGSLRMEAPIPGKSAVGIEIPNKKSSIVRLRDLLETPDFESNKSKTVVCIGRDVAGQPVFGDLAKMPHLLIAGATGMGKSVCINALLISVLYKARPDEVKLIMIDPKQVEFTMYNGIPHLLVPVVSDAKQAAGALMWAVEEMERRYNLLNPLCVRNIEAYNEKVTADPSLGEPLPKIIIVIDEFADLMLQVKDPVENLVTRIAQKARAAGIHLVIGTQRPSVNVITGVIKANVPSRISCKVMSNVDSKTVLDSAGAEKLLDKGDALYAPAGSPKPHRLQCAFVADSEVEDIMNFLKQNNDGAGYDSTVMEDIERAAQKCSKKGGSSDRDDDDRDESSGEGYLNDRQFLDAVEIAVNTRKISTSLIQRKLSIGYGKAAKFIDIMEDMGIVGEANGQRPREVKLTPDEWREKLARASLD